jgi:hypothetical protein
LNATALGILVVDSSTSTDGMDGQVVVSGSHGGRYPAVLTAAAGARAAIFNDASRGLDDSGIAGVAWLGTVGVPAAAVGHLTACIGDGGSSLNEGRLTEINDPAAALGCRPDMPAWAAAQLLRVAPDPSAAAHHAVPDEARHELAADGDVRAVALDSASLVAPADADAVVFCGSHGALIGGRPEMALRHPVRLAIFNDAGGGPDGRGRTRLGALADRRIAAATVSAATARLGDGRSTYATGVLSEVNEVARRQGLVPGMPARDATEAIRRYQQEKAGT